MGMIRLFRKKCDDAYASRCIIVAPDKFKGTLSASEVTSVITEAIRSSDANVLVKECPMADGGEGSATLIARMRNLKPMTATGHNALMQSTDISYYADDSVCAVDSAAIVGLAQLSETPLQPWLATTYGIGEFIRLMLSRGMKEIIIGIGGTATVDGGIGMLQALGTRFYDAEGEELGHTPLRACDLSSVYKADFSEVPRTDLQRAVSALADVDVPLLPSESEAISGLSSLSFARQKGISTEEIPLLRSALENYVCAIDNALYSPSSQPHFQGAGGGLGYALHRVLKCRCRSGAGYFISKYQIFPEDASAEIDTSTDSSALPAYGKYSSENFSLTSPVCIITGEGCLDEQSLGGKVTGTLYSYAGRMGIPTIIVCGKCTLNHRYPDMEIIPVSPDNAAHATHSHDVALNKLNEAMPRLIHCLHVIFSSKHANTAL